MNIYKILLLSAVTVVACTNEKATEKKQQTSVKTQEVKVAQTVVSLKDDRLNAVYQQYLSLSSALIQSDLAMAKEASMALELGAKTLSSGKKLAELAAKITLAKDIEAQRKLFSNLSDEMIEKVKAIGLNTGEVYVEFCPMALNDKGAFWLSNQKQIKNPYYGESMLDCGEVKDTLR